MLIWPANATIYRSTETLHILAVSRPSRSAAADASRPWMPAINRRSTGVMAFGAWSARRWSRVTSLAACRNGKLIFSRQSTKRQSRAQRNGQTADRAATGLLRSPGRGRFIAFWKYELLNSLKKPFRSSCMYSTYAEFFTHIYSVCKMVGGRICRGEESDRYLQSTTRGLWMSWLWQHRRRWRCFNGYVDW